MVVARQYDVETQVKAAEARRDKLMGRKAAKERRGSGQMDSPIRIPSSLRMMAGTAQRYWQ